MSSEKRAVYIGGFGNGKWAAAAVREALTDYYPAGVTTFTFAQAMCHPESVAEVMEGAAAVTHSAGILAVRHAYAPSEIRAFSPPLPASKAQLVGRSIRKTVRMHSPGVGIQAPVDARAVAAYDASSMAEHLIHPGANMGRLRAISRFDAAAYLVTEQIGGIAASACYTKGDEFFQPDGLAVSHMAVNGVDVVTLPGIHDELVIRPGQTLERYFAQTELPL